MALNERLELLSANTDVLLIATIGGVVLFGLQLASHFQRKELDKLSKGRYAVFFLFSIICLPASAAIVSGLYILNGEKLGVLLAFQVGLSSPAILKSLIVASADKVFSKNTVATGDGQ